MRIRLAQEDDVPAIARIAALAYGPYVELIGRRPHPLDDDYAEKLRGGPLFVAEDGDVVVGLLVLEPREGHLLLENVAVDPDRQGEGIGSALLEKAEATALELGYSTVRLYTNSKMERNVEMYRRKGYREERRGAVDGFDRVFFAKRL